jgi:hypothetical protein
MVDTMNREERVSHEPIADKEGPTHVAELFIRLVPQDTGNRQFTRPPGFRPRFKMDRTDTSSARRRIRAAIEAEAAAVPEVGAEIIDRELSRIMSPRPAVNAPGATRSGHRVPRDKRPSLMEVLRGSLAGASWRPDPHEPEPTTAAELHITLVHS